MWHSGSKCQRIKTLVKANCKRLEVTLILRVKKLGLLFLTSKLDEFPLFDKFFYDLANFWDLDHFLPFKFLDFLIYSIQLSPNPSTLPLLLFLSEAGLLPLFLLEAGLLPSFLLKASMLPLFLQKAGLLLSFLIEAGLLLSFLLKAGLLLPFLLEAALLDNLVIFNIEISGAAI